MSGVETLQQANMFSGEWETKRTRNRLEQLSMFSINETFEFGARVRPYLSEAPRPTLELIREDVRTPEEIEHDLMRGAEALTTPMFTSEALPASEAAPERKEPDTHDAHKPLDTSTDGEELTKFSAYRALVTLVREQTMTLWVDSAYRQRYYNQLPLTIQAAQDTGLTASEISAAMQIGEFLGNRERQAAGQTSQVVFEANSEPAVALAPVGQPPVIREVEAHDGLRARLRRERVAVRTRQSNPTAPKVVPVFWMEREHIQKRLPYLAEGIGRLDGDELASLAESISEVLQETYWTMLGITLAHYLDHEQGERRERIT